MDITGILLIAIVAATAAAYKFSNSFREWVDIIDQMEYKEEEDKA
jgi:hypothetical protein